MLHSIPNVIPVLRLSLTSVAIATAFLTAPLAHAADPAQASVRASAASALIVASTAAVVVVGSIETLALTGRAVVASVAAVGDGSVVVLRGVSEVGAAASLVTIRVAGGVSLAAGTVVEVVASATGCALTSAGRIIAFVPNEVGRSLIRQSHATAAR